MKWVIHIEKSLGYELQLMELFLGVGYHPCESHLCLLEERSYFVFYISRTSVEEEMMNEILKSDKTLHTGFQTQQFS